MMNRAAVAASLLVSLSAAAAYAEGDNTNLQPTNANVQAENANVQANTVNVQANTVIVNGRTVVSDGAVQPAGPQSVAPALQPPGADEMPPAPPAPPQNENWNNVSHINGQVVPVGERGAYLYSFKKNNVMTNPIGWMFGWYQLAASHAVSQNIAVSVEVSGWSHGSTSGYQLAATVPIYFRRTYSGPFLEAGLVLHTDTSDYLYDCYDCTSGGSNSNSWAGPEVMLGWSWIFDSGLNMSFAFGAAKKMTNDSMSTYSSDEPEPAGYFRVGYAF